MLSVKKCRELVGNNSNLSDELLEKLRDELYSLANVILDGTTAAQFSSLREASGHKSEKHDNSGAGATCRLVGVASPYADVLALLPEDDRYALEERTAIHEFDGGCTREQAEKLALDEHWKNKLTGGADEY